MFHVSHLLPSSLAYHHLCRRNGDPYNYVSFLPCNPIFTNDHLSSTFPTSAKNSILLFDRRAGLLVLSLKASY